MSKKKIKHLEEKYLDEAFNPSRIEKAPKILKKKDKLRANARQNYMHMSAIRQSSTTAANALHDFANQLQDLGQTAHARKIAELTAQVQKVGQIVAKKYQT